MPLPTHTIKLPEHRSCRFRKRIRGQPIAPSRPLSSTCTKTLERPGGTSTWRNLDRLRWASRIRVEIRAGNLAAHQRRHRRSKQDETTQLRGTAREASPIPHTQTTNSADSQRQFLPRGSLYAEPASSLNFESSTVPGLDL